MKKNIGAAEGIVRLLLAITLICYAIIAGPWWIALFSIFFIATSVVMWSPTWEILGVNTNKGETQHS